MKRELVAGALLIAAAMGACGGEAEPTPTAVSGRYCELVVGLNADADRLLAPVRDDGGITRRELRRAERRYNLANAATIEELARVAPSELQQDVLISTAASRARAGLETAAPSRRQVAAADARLRAYGTENCPGFESEMDR